MKRLDMNLWHGHNVRRLRAPLFLSSFGMGLIYLALGWLILVKGLVLTN